MSDPQRIRLKHALAVFMPRKWPQYVIVDALDPNVEPCRANEFTFAVKLEGLVSPARSRSMPDLLRN